MGHCTGYAFGGLLGGIGVASVDHDAGALVGEQLGDRQPDAAGSTDDDGAAALEWGANYLRPLGRTPLRPCSSTRAGW